MLARLSTAPSDRFIITFILVAINYYYAVTALMCFKNKLKSVHYFSICVVIPFLVQFVRLEFHSSPGTDVILNISEFSFCHVYFSRPGGRCTCTFNCFIIWPTSVNRYSFSIIMATDGLLKVLRRGLYLGPRPTSILFLVGHSFVRRLFVYLLEQHVYIVNLFKCFESYKVDVLASGGLTMPKLWKIFSPMNDIAGGRDPLSLADDVYMFANCLLANDVRTMVLVQVFLEIPRTRVTILSRILTSMSWCILSTRKYLPAKISSRENIFPQKYLPAIFFACRKDVGW